MSMNTWTLSLLALVISLPLHAAEGFSSLEEQMSGSEFTAAGLDKLSQQELTALNNWIRSRSLATLDTPKTDASERGLENQKASTTDRSAFSSRIKGSFTGWDGNTVFELENGMIWEQADDERFYIREIQNPAVTIEPGIFKTWRLSVEGYSSACKVKRIQ
ncbi:MAG: hypothetical protein RQ826_00975 [Xanthomonadales bacterium]|nr:hypothetical protein [Xanthomonadales bacterium]